MYMSVIYVGTTISAYREIMVVLTVCESDCSESAPCFWRGCCEIDDPDKSRPELETLGMHLRYTVELRLFLHTEGMNRLNLHEPLGRAKFLKFLQLPMICLDA